MTATPRSSGCGRGMPGSPSAPPVEPVEVVEQRVEDHADRERHDDEKVAAQPKARKADQQAHHARRERTARERWHETDHLLLHQQRRGVGADAGKSHVAERNEAGVAEQQIEPDRRHGVAQRQRQDVQRIELTGRNDWNHV